MNTVIKAENLYKTYKLYENPKDRLVEAINPFSKKRHTEFNALGNVSFSIEKGESVGIIGKNGSGKSTLLKILTGVITETAGSLKTKGRIAALIELGAGFNPEYTGKENIYLNAAIMGCSKTETDGKLDSILEFAEIGDFIHQPVKTYSSGMFVRLAFSVAIHVNPDILIVDEALAVGDYRFQAKCYNKFEELKAEGKTVLFVSHDIDAVRRFCTRAIWLDAGELILDGDVRDVTSKYMEFITDATLTKPQIEEVEITEEKKQVLKFAGFDPINRFGSDVGCVKSMVLEKNGKACNDFFVNDKVSAEIEIDVPSSVDLSGAAVSVGIKDKNGLDIFVTSTYDKGIKIKSYGKLKLLVSFMNYLNQGTYTLTVSLENRNTAPISYYDYIEGAAYLKVGAEKELFGFVQLPSEIGVIGAGEEN